MALLQISSRWIVIEGVLFHLEVPRRTIRQIKFALSRMRWLIGRWIFGSFLRVQGKRVKPYQVLGLVLKESLRRVFFNPNFSVLTLSLEVLLETMVCLSDFFLDFNLFNLILRRLKDFFFLFFLWWLGLLFLFLFGFFISGRFSKSFFEFCLVFVRWELWRSGHFRSLKYLSVIHAIQIVSKVVKSVYFFFDVLLE